MKKIVFVVFIFLFSCESNKDEINDKSNEPEVVINWITALEDDIIYKQLVDRSIQSVRITTEINRWLSVFVLDAERVSGLDLSYVLDSEINFRPSSEIPSAYGGWAWGSCDDNRVEISLQEYLLNGNMPAYYDNRAKENFSNTIYTFYHEFGHDILNMSHTCNEKDIMFSSSQDPDQICSGDLIQIDYDFETHPRFDYQGFLIARDRLFKGIEQFQKNCDNE